MSEEDDLRRQLKGAHMSGALVYAAFYDELCTRSARRSQRTS